jgi:tetratricopeptide (TPR) repeat protein
MKSTAPRLALLLAACAVLTKPSAALEAAPAPSDENAAVLALLDSAEQSMSAGRPREAAVVLERALRIEPHNRTVWHYLGRARFELGDYAQAEAMAAKSHTLAAADRSLRTRNVELMAAAQKAAGKPVAVPSSEPPSPALQRLFAAEVEPARSYLGSDVGEERRSGFAVPSPDWQRLEVAYAEGVRRARTTWRDEVRRRSVAVLDSRERRYRASETRRRQL